jgi:hypothetical protein
MIALGSREYGVLFWPPAKVERQKPGFGEPTVNTGGYSTALVRCGINMEKSLGGTA